MKKTILTGFALLVCAGMAMAQATYNSIVPGTSGIRTPIDKLGAHQNGGRGCVGCHTPHSGARGNGGTMAWNGTAFVSMPTQGDTGDEALWGQDIGPVVSLGTIQGPPRTGGFYDVPVDLTSLGTRPRVKTGVVFCLSCHDGNVAKGAMMTNVSFEQSAGLLPPTAGYNGQNIPTLLGNDGGRVNNYENDHPIGPFATVDSLGTGATSGIGRFLALNSTTTKLVSGATFLGSAYDAFRNSYGLPTVIGARAGAGFAVESGMTGPGQAYVVCTTCHTPHSMYTTNAGAASSSNPDGNPIATQTSGTFPTYFFIAAPYNPAADTAGGTRASSATQFCRQCHFTGAGGSNEASNIWNVPTAF
jgi:hypothetical protein